MDGDLNLIEHRACRKCGEIFILDKNDECETCAAPATKQRLVTQNEVLDHLDSVGLEASHRDDRTLPGAVGPERIDRIYAHAECPRAAFLEVDEHQHSRNSKYMRSPSPRRDDAQAES